MKYLLTLITILFAVQAFSQQIMLRVPMSSNSINVVTPKSINTPGLDIIKEYKGAKLISVRTVNPYLNKTYLISKEGETLSTGYMPSQYFRPNDNNLIVVSGFPEKRDSFNPYGAYDMSSMILFTTVNSFISKIKIGRR